MWELAFKEMDKRNPDVLGLYIFTNFFKTKDNLTNPSRASMYNGDDFSSKNIYINGVLAKEYNSNSFLFKKKVTHFSPAENPLVEIVSLEIQGRNINNSNDLIWFENLLSTNQHFTYSKKDGVDIYISKPNSRKANVTIKGKEIFDIQELVRRPTSVRLNSSITFSNSSYFDPRVVNVQFFISKNSYYDVCKISMVVTHGTFPPKETLAKIFIELHEGQDTEITSKIQESTVYVNIMNQKLSEILEVIPPVYKGRSEFPYLSNTNYHSKYDEFIFARNWTMEVRNTLLKSVESLGNELLLLIQGSGINKIRYSINQIHVCEIVLS